MKTVSTSLVVALLLLGGCTAAPSHFTPQDTTKYSLEYTDSFVLMGKQIQHSVTSTGIQYHNLPDGRLEIVANIKNKENSRTRVEVSCVFKNEEGVAIGDETAWQTLLLRENATEGVTFTSTNNAARKYTVRVRQAQ